MLHEEKDTESVCSSEMMKDWFVVGTMKERRVLDLALWTSRDFNRRLSAARVCTLGWPSAFAIAPQPSRWTLENFLVKLWIGTRMHWFFVVHYFRPAVV